jgi:hypothetical protein
VERAGAHIAAANCATTLIIVVTQVSKSTTRSKILQNDPNPPYNLRMRPDLRMWLTDFAARNFRTLNATLYMMLVEMRERDERELAAKQGAKKTSKGEVA